MSQSNIMALYKNKKVFNVENPSLLEGWIT